MSLRELLDVKVSDIATGTLRKTYKSASSVKVYDQKDFKRMGARNLQEALNQIPGINMVSGAYNLTQGSVINIRGLMTQENPQVLYMINGQPAQNPFVVTGMPHRLRHSYPISYIERVEIIKGPGSALYGADALSGVINVITKNAKSLEETEVGGAYGSYDHKSLYLNHTQKMGNFSIYFGGHLINSNVNDEKYNRDAQSVADEAQSTNYSLAPGPSTNKDKSYDLLTNITYKDKLSLEAMIISWNSTITGFTGSLTPNSIGGKKTHYRARLIYEDQVSPKSDIKLSAAYNKNSQVYGNDTLILSPTKVYGDRGMLGRPEYWVESFNVDNNYDFKPTKDISFRFGLGFKSYNLYRVQDSSNFDTSFSPRGGLVNITDTSDIFMPEEEGFASYGLVQIEYQITPKLYTVAGARLDRFSGVGHSFNPRAAVVYDIIDDLTGRVMYGTAFRAPSMSELHIQNNPVLVGNKDVRPEESETTEIALSQIFGNDHELHLNLFKYNMRNQIGSVGTQYGNASGIKGKGGELEYQLNNLKNQFDISASYAYAIARDAKEGYEIQGLVKHMLLNTLRWRYNKSHHFSLTTKYVDEMTRERLHRKDKLRPQLFTTFSYNWNQITKGLDGRFIVDNIFDKKQFYRANRSTFASATISEPDDTPRKRFNLYGELTYSF